MSREIEVRYHKSLDKELRRADIEDMLDKIGQANPDSEHGRLACETVRTWAEQNPPLKQADTIGVLLDVVACINRINPMFIYSFVTALSDSVDDEEGDCPEELADFRGPVQ